MLHTQRTYGGDAHVGRDGAPGAEDALAELVSMSPVVCYESRPTVPGGGAETFRTTYMSPNAERVLGYPAAAFVAAGTESLLLARMHAADRPGALAAVSAAFARRAPELEAEYRFHHGDGRVLHVHTTLRLEYDADGAPRRVLGYKTDVTERRRADEQRRATEARYQSLMRATNEVLYEFDPAEGALRFSGALESAFGLAAPPAGETFDWWLRRVHPDDVVTLGGIVRRLLAGREPHATAEYRLRRGDGTFAWVVARAFVEWHADGRPARVVGSMADVTERRQLEEQLRHAQKLEAVGRLAGSIAHDFNNLLTVIRTRGEFLRDAVPARSPAGEDAAELICATERAARLTAQLLAFSRRQPTALAPVSLNDAVRGVETMLRQLVGRDVRLVLRLAESLGAARADAGQVEQVLMNLAVNARDAMPAGGTLTIETADVVVRDGDAAERGLGARPGAYARLLVRDTGTGMDAATRERAFEPFFTTKPAGKGTGLGLSTVYSIVRQSGGVVLLETAPCRGATFSVLLPRAFDDGAAAAAAPAAVGAGAGGSEPAGAPGPGGIGHDGAAAPAPAAGGAPAGPPPAARPPTTLVVDDEPAVRHLTRRVLVRAGHVVLEAANGAEARVVAAAHGGVIDLLVTDLQLPDVQGRVLASELRAMRPALRVLVVSGYPDAGDDPAAPLDVRFLAKPFTPTELVDAARAALAG